MGRNGATACHHAARVPPLKAPGEANSVRNTTHLSATRENTSLTMPCFCSSGTVVNPKCVSVAAPAVSVLSQRDARSATPPMRGADNARLRMARLRFRCPGARRAGPNLLARVHPPSPTRALQGTRRNQGHNHALTNDATGEGRRAGSANHSAQGVCCGA
jgi:hypothetical protein